MSSNRVNWTCPSCGKVYAVPTTIGLTVCPACNPTAISPPRAVSVTLPRSALIGLLIVVAVLGFTAGLATAAMRDSHVGAGLVHGVLVNVASVTSTLSFVHGLLPILMKPTKTVKKAPHKSRK